MPPLRSAPRCSDPKLMAARVSRRSPNHVYDLIRAGHLPALRFGRAVRIPRDRLLAWLNDGGRNA